MPRISTTKLNYFTPNLTDTEEMLRQLQQHNPDEFERIVNLPNGIRTSRLSQETGTFVFCESSNINNPSANRYPQLLLLDLVKLSAAIFPRFYC